MLLSNRVYSNQGNQSLIDLLDKGCKRVLDVGCGAGDNAALIRAMHLHCDIRGITHSAVEANLARKHMAQCWVFDIENEFPADLLDQSFDVLIFSHVLEHLRDPAVALVRFLRLLRIGGQVLIAVPNVLAWPMRLKFLRGNFEYQSEGVLDDTHLRFFTYFTTERYLLSTSPDIEVTRKATSGSLPLWLLRRYIMPRSWTEWIDRWACRHWPNLFGTQILISGIKK